MKTPVTIIRRAIRNPLYAKFATVLAAGLFIAGCGPSNQPTDEERQDKALKDPFSYSPDLKNSDMTVSGHDEFDKQELKRDVDHVINP